MLTPGIVHGTRTELLSTGNETKFMLKDSKFYVGKGYLC